MEKKYYVYFHKINDEIFYIGSNYMAGNPNRAYEKIGRPEKWHEIVNANNGKYDIEIHQYFDTSREARKAETFLIHFYHDIMDWAVASGEDRRGERHPLFGISRPEEFKQKMKQKMTGKGNPMSQAIVVFKNGELYGKYESSLLFAKEFELKGKDDSTVKAVRNLVNGWKPSRGRWIGWSACYLDDYEKQLQESK